MRKIAFLCLAVIFALGTLGVGYAMWSDTLTVTGNVYTGEVNIDFTSQYDNDATNQNDPDEAGAWVGFDIDEPEWTGTRYGKNVASTTSTYTDNSSQIIITNGYPSYWGSTVWDLTNKGTVPVKLWSVSLTELSFGGQATWTGSKALEIGVRYYVDVDTNTVDEAWDFGDDFSFILSAHRTEQIDPQGWDSTQWNTRGYIDVTIHVEQEALQKSNYDFKLDWVFAQWNEPEPS